MANSDVDNRSNQLNPNNDAYYQSRGYQSREDNYDSGEYSGPYIAGPQPKQPSLAAEDREKRFLNKERGRIVSSMTTSKATEMLWHLLLHDFPDLDFDADHCDGNIRLVVKGCVRASKVAQSVETAINDWLEERHWLIGKSVEGVQLSFKA